MLKWPTQHYVAILLHHHNQNGPWIVSHSVRWPIIATSWRHDKLFWPSWKWPLTWVSSNQMARNARSWRHDRPFSPSVGVRDTGPPVYSTETPRPFFWPPWGRELPSGLRSPCKGRLRSRHDFCIHHTERNMEEHLNEQSVFVKNECPSGNKVQKGYF